MAVGDLLNDEPRDHIVEGVVARPEPEAVTDPLYVTVLGLEDTDLREGPCPWMPRVDDDGAPVLPVENNPCAIAYSDARTPWVIAWWPEEVPNGD